MNFSNLPCDQIFSEVVEGVIFDQIKLLGTEAIQAAVRLRTIIIKEKCAQRMLEMLMSEVIIKESRAVASTVAYEAIETR